MPRALCWRWNFLRKAQHEHCVGLRKANRHCCGGGLECLIVEADWDADAAIGEAGEVAPVD